MQTFAAAPPGTYLIFVDELNVHLSDDLARMRQPELTGEAALSGSISGVRAHLIIGFKCDAGQTSPVFARPAPESGKWYGYFLDTARDRAELGALVHRMAADTVKADRS